MMILGIISDTHIDFQEKEIPDIILKTLEKSQRIIHGGDFGRNPGVISALSGIAPVTAVRGNHDKKKDKKLPQKAILELEGWKIGIIHGNGINKIKKEPHNLIEKFNKELDIIIFGHIHRPMMHSDGDVIIINPGSAAKPPRAPFSSFIIAELHERQIRLNLHFLDEDQKRITKVARAVFYKNRG